MIKITTYCLCLGMAVALQAQQAERFSVATLNIDGLPKKILVVNSNPDGPGGPGTVRIGNYFMKRGYDMMFMQNWRQYWRTHTTLTHGQAPLALTCQTRRLTSSTCRTSSSNATD